MGFDPARKFKQAQDTVRSAGLLINGMSGFGGRDHIALGLIPDGGITQSPACAHSIKGEGILRQDPPSPRIPRLANSSHRPQQPMQFHSAVTAFVCPTDFTEDQFRLCSSWAFALARARDGQAAFPTCFAPLGYAAFHAANPRTTVSGEDGDELVTLHLGFANNERIAMKIQSNRQEGPAQYVVPHTFAQAQIRDMTRLVESGNKALVHTVSAMAARTAPAPRFCTSQAYAACGTDAHAATVPHPHSPPRARQGQNSHFQYTARLGKKERKARKQLELQEREITARADQERNTPPRMTRGTHNRRTRAPPLPIVGPSSPAPSYASERQTPALPFPDMDQFMREATTEPAIAPIPLPAVTPDGFYVTSGDNTPFPRPSSAPAAMGRFFQPEVYAFMPYAVQTAFSPDTNIVPTYYGDDGATVGVNATQGLGLDTGDATGVQVNATGFDATAVDTIAAAFAVSHVSPSY